MPTLSVPGATLSYSTSSPSSPLSGGASSSSQPTSQRHFVLIPGAPGTSSVFDLLAPALVERGFTVTTYTRRGYTSSPLATGDKGDGGLEQDADDAASLLQHLFPEKTPNNALTPSTPSPRSQPQLHIFATSSGGIVALSLLQRHSHLASRCNRILIHEPPLISVYPTPVREKMRPRFANLYDMYQTHGPEAAVKKWISLFVDKWEREEGILQLMGLDGRSVGDKDQGQIEKGNENERPGGSKANMVRWLEHEMRQFTAASSINLTTLGSIPAEAREKALLIAGELSFDDLGKTLTLGAIAAPIIAGIWEQEVVKVPGGHIGYANGELVGWFAGVLEGLLTRDGGEQF